jgi:hypothetical protein
MYVFSVPNFDSNAGCCKVWLLVSAQQTAPQHPCALHDCDVLRQPGLRPAAVRSVSRLHASLAAAFSLFVPQMLQQQVRNNLQASQDKVSRVAA